MGTAVRNERGSILIMAVIAMLIMGVLSVAFALMADIETKIGVNYKQQAQAEALAEAGLEIARDAIRPAAISPGGFTPWLAGPLLANGVIVGPGRYWARIDNDCSPLVPVAIQQQPAQPGDPVCPTTTDLNEAAVLTGWATAGTGRARVRAIVGVDNPWKHVCSNVKPDNNGYCNDPSNMNGEPVVIPADPNDPNGPAAYDDLPRPILGCSRIDPTMHGSNFAECPIVPGPGPLYAYPYGAAAAGKRLVLMGTEPTPGGAEKYCYDDPAAGKYFGYFDCALQTPCVPAVDSGVGGGSGACKTLRPACVKWNDSRINGTTYVGTILDSGGNRVCPNGATGMVFNWYPNADPLVDRKDPASEQRNPTFNGTIGGCSVGEQLVSTWDCPGTPNGRNIYVLSRGGDGRIKVEKTGADRTHVYGTLVVEGDSTAPPGGCDGTPADIFLGNRGTLTAAKWNGTYGGYVYGYPLALVVFDPMQPFWSPGRPSVEPYTPQTTCADMGSSNTAVNGMIYSGGHVQFNPISVNGSVVAFEIQTQGGANAGMGYNATYGNESPPPGFPYGAGNQVVIIRKSFIVCTNFNDESGSATACN